MTKCFGLFVMFGATAATAQAPISPDPAAQKAALAGLARFDGTWRGTAAVYQKGAPPLQLIQTERVGQMLGGTLKVIEGKSFAPDGRETSFNAFAILSCYQPAVCEMRSYAQGRAGTFPITIRDGGFSWSIDAGPGDKIVYTATNDGRVWREEGWFEHQGQRVTKIFEMAVARVAATACPGAGAVTAK